MTREEAIISEAVNYGNRIFGEKPAEYLIASVGFTDGALWADKNPDLSSLWHDASEEPIEYPILCKDKLGNIWIEYSLNGWAECVEFNDIIQWAYISDLLPKGGVI